MSNIGTFTAGTKILSSVMNGKLNGLGDGTLDDTANSLLKTRRNGGLNFVLNGLTIGTSVSLVASMGAGEAYVQGYYVTPASQNHTFTLSKDTYVDLKTDGTYVYTEVNNSNAAPAMTTNTDGTFAIRVAKVITSATAVTTVQQYGWDAGTSFNSLAGTTGNPIYPNSPFNLSVEGVIYPTLVNSWVNHAISGDVWAFAGYWKDIFGVVHLQGLIKNGTSPATVFTLPVGFRPKDSQIFTGIATAGTARIDVTAAGLVQVAAYQATGSNGYVSLAGITFRAN